MLQANAEEHEEDVGRKKEEIAKEETYMAWDSGLYKFNKTTYWLKLDKQNRQVPFSFIAKALSDDSWVCGNIVVEPGIYSPDVYIMYTHNGYNESWGNSYGWTKTVVDPDTNVPDTQKNYIQYLFRRYKDAETVILTDGSKPIANEIGEYEEIIRIRRGEPLPDYLWEDV